MSSVPPHISSAQGIATYLLMSDEKTINNMFLQGSLIAKNLLVANDKLLIDLEDLEDRLDLTENKTWEYQNGWKDYTSAEEQQRIKNAIVNEYPKLKDNADINQIANSVALYLLYTDNPSSSVEHKNNVSVIVDNLLMAHCVENLDLYSLKKCLSNVVQFPTKALS